MNINLMVAIAVLLGGMGLSSLVTYMIVQPAKVDCPPAVVIEQPDALQKQKLEASERFHKRDFVPSKSGKGF